MRLPTESYLKVHYELRPAKQIERRMLVDALQMLSLAGLPISEYQYTGFGSIFFVDFILFHKLLGVWNMLSVEHSESIKKRIKFNKPFDCIRIEFGPISNVIPNLSPDRKHFLWLDYDDVIHRSHVEDIFLAASHLSSGSLLLITVDVEPPGKDDGPEQWRDHFEEEAGRYLISTKVEDFTKSNIPRINIQIIERVIRDGLAAREDIKFLPLFNFLYADGHQMLTLGGIIGSDIERRHIRGSKLEEVNFVRRDFSKEPFRIRVPNLTRKERLYLDSNMPCTSKWKPKEFEMLPDDIAAYREIYRFFPAYAELLL